MEAIPRWLIKTIAALVAVLLVIVGINQIYSVKDKATAVDQQHVINISAEGKVTVQPDLASINIAVQNDGDTAAAAQAANTKSMNSVISYIKSQGIDDKDIQTSGYNVSPRYDYTNGKSNIVGYTAYNNVTVKVRDLTKVSGILDGTVKNGANSINGVNYSFDDPDSFREQARELALKNARDKAQKLADAAGVHLGKLVSFSENSNIPTPIYYDKAAAPMGMGGGGSTPNVEPGVQDITAQVSVSYEIY